MGLLEIFTYEDLAIKNPSIQVSKGTPTYPESRIPQASPFSPK